MADTKTIMTDVEGRMQRAIDHLEEELNNVRAGKASPNVLNGVMVDYYGSMTPVSGVASVTVPDAKTILIQPWDKKMIKPIEKAIIDIFEMVKKADKKVMTEKWGEVVKEYQKLNPLLKDLEELLDYNRFEESGNLVDQKMKEILDHVIRMIDRV